MKDTRLSSALHLLVLVSEAKTPMSSEQMAESMGTNASYVRKLAGLLRKAGIVQSRQRSSACLGKAAPSCRFAGFPTASSHDARGCPYGSASRLGLSVASTTAWRPNVGSATASCLSTRTARGSHAFPNSWETGASKRPWTNTKRSALPGTRHHVLPYANKSSAVISAWTSCQ